VSLLKKILLSVSFALSTGTAVAADPSVFINATAGIQVKKPVEWVYISAEQNMDSIKALKLGDDELHAMMQKYVTAPLVVMAKFPEPFDDLNPSFKVNLKPYGIFKGKQPQEIMSILVPQFKKIFKDFVIVQPPTEVVVSQITSAYARMNYTIEIPDGRTFPTTSELWIVPYGDYYFMIGAGTRQDGKTGSREEIQSILKTVKIDHISK
jgi:hypothetical protein